MNLLLFEFKKIIRTKAFPIFLIVTLALITGLFLRNVILQDTIVAQKIEHFSEYASEVSSENTGDNMTLHRDGPNAAIEERLEVGKLLADQLSQLLGAIQNNLWEEELQVEIEVYETAITYKNMNGNFRASIADMEDISRLNEELLRVGLPKENMDLSIQTSIFLKKVVSLFLSTPGFLVFLLVLGVSITREFEDRNIQMVYALPIARLQYVLTKFTSVLLCGVSWLAVVFITSYLLPLVFGHNEGNIFHYPLFTAEGNFITTGDYVKKTILYSALFMTFTVSLLTLLGFLTKNTIVSYLVGIFVFVGSWIVIENGMVFSLNPLTYQNIDASSLYQQGYDVKGICALLIASVVLLALTSKDSWNWRSAR
ncbi:ABC transporter permease [Oceanobacillus manasiensis]|uniref:ABC transporter permease n=1 Tax=Oceanobacillus manasiensis TaxID=586413 RepID=UPI0005AA2832|nr:ABC transporter permease subunit [Oceanobacillus manasiensis]